MNYGAYGNYGHNAIMFIFWDMAIVAIDAIVDPRPSILVYKEEFGPQEGFYPNKITFFLGPSDT